MQSMPQTRALLGRMYASVGWVCAPFDFYLVKDLNRDRYYIGITYNNEGLTYENYKALQKVLEPYAF